MNMIGDSSNLQRGTFQGFKNTGHIRKEFGLNGWGYQMFPVFGTKY